MCQETKICSKCKEEKPATREYFYWRKESKRNKAGFTYYCKQCHILQRKNSHNVEKHSAYCKSYDTKESPAVYLVKNLITGKTYIGKSINPVWRRCAHFSKHKNKQGEYSIPSLYNDIDKYGKNAFVFGILEYCDENELNKKEQDYINKYKPFYNA